MGLYQHVNCNTCRHNTCEHTKPPCSKCDTFTEWEPQERLSLDEYQQLAERTATITNKLPQILFEQMRFINFGMGLAGEAGETCDYLKKVVFHGHTLDKDKLKKELGDCLWYIATLATTAGLSLADVATANIEKLRARYPEGFDQARSINRED